VHRASSITDTQTARPRTCVMIAGMHRSGTSALARVVNLLGADITNEPIPAIAGDNDRGFWESMELNGVHARLLRELGSSWDDPLPLPDHWPDTLATQHAKRLIIDHVDEQFAGSRLFVVKDPRIARLAPLWLRILDELDVRPVVIVPFRHPLEVAASLKRRNGLPTARAMLCYIHSNLEVELASRGRTRVFHLYDDLVSDWRTFAAKLRDVAGLACSPSPATIAEIDGFLTAELRHHRFDRDGGADMPDVTKTALEIHDRMLEAAAGGNDRALRLSFDRLRATIEGATKLYRELALAEIDGRAEAAHVNDAARAELQQRDARIAALELEVQECNSRIEGLDCQVRQRDTVIENLSVQLRQRATQIERLRTMLRTRWAELADAHRKYRRARDAQVMLLSSTSWRLTAPLRAIRRVMRTIRRTTASASERQRRRHPV
jgi:O-antigen biosynthesis protein